jgi:hypothetical protein
VKRLGQPHHLAKRRFALTALDAGKDRLVQAATLRELPLGQPSPVPRSSEVFHVPRLLSQLMLFQQLDCHFSIDMEKRQAKRGSQMLFSRIGCKSGIIQSGQSRTDGSFIVDLLLKNGLRLKTFKEEVNLEHVFLEITKGITNQAAARRSLLRRPWA